MFQSGRWVRSLHPRPSSPTCPGSTAGPPGPLVPAGAYSGGAGRRHEGKGGGHESPILGPSWWRVTALPCLTVEGQCRAPLGQPPPLSLPGVSVAVVPTAWAGVLPSWGPGMAWALEGLAREGECTEPMGLPTSWGEILSLGGLSHMPLTGTHEGQSAPFPWRGRLWRIGDSRRRHLVIRWPPPGVSSCTRQGLSSELVGLRVDWGSLACAEAAGQGERPWPQLGDQAPGPRVCALRPGRQWAQGWGQAILLSLSPRPESWPP